MAVERFALEWISAWNSHDIEMIMQHYADQIDFTSPVIQQVGYSKDGKIYDKTALKAYFRLALQKYPDLHFELVQVLSGVGTVVLYYKSIQGKYTAEYMEWDQEDRICVVKAHYSKG